MVYNYATVLMIATVALNAGHIIAGPIVSTRSVHSDLSSSSTKDHRPGSGKPNLCGHPVKPSAPISKLPTVPATSSLPHSGSPHSSAASFPVPISSGLPKPSGVSVASTKPTPSSGSSAIPSGHLPEFEKRARNTGSASKSASVPLNSGVSSVPGHHSAVSSAVPSRSTLPSCGKAPGSMPSAPLLLSATPGPSSDSPLPSGIISNPPGPSSTATSRSGSPRPSAIVDKRAGNVLLKASGPVPSGVPSPSIVSPLPPHSAASSVSAPVPSGGVASSTVPSPSAPASCEPEPVTSVVSSVLPSGSSPPLPSASATTSVVSIKSALPLSSGVPHLPPKPPGIPLIDRDYDELD
ncbi:hypothetical protein DFH09DRAFT_1370173 [Mycena vulgaris]|nr:hypothetical protein DFH09DRAFT_1370173 [Mycena vulgaris]